WHRSDRGERHATRTRRSLESPQRSRLAAGHTSRGGRGFSLATHGSGAGGTRWGAGRRLVGHYAGRADRQRRRTGAHLFQRLASVALAPVDFAGGVFGSNP